MRRILPILLSVLLLSSPAARPEKVPLDAPLCRSAPFSSATETAYPDRLVPSEDYGILYPFIGRQVTVNNGAYTYKENVYGLATAAGEIVMGPVYSRVFCLYYHSGGTPLPVMELHGDLLEEQNVYSGTVAALDGRWVMEATYADIDAVSETAFLLEKPAGVCCVYDLSGALLHTFSLPEGLQRISYWYDGRALYKSDHTYYLVNVWTGAAKALDVPWVLGTDGRFILVQDERDLVGYLDMDGNWAVPSRYKSLGMFVGDLANAVRADGTACTVDIRGNEYEGEGPSYRPPNALRYISDGLYQWTDTSELVHLPKERLETAGISVVGDCLVCYNTIPFGEEPSYAAMLLDRYGNILIPAWLYKDFRGDFDQVTTEEYIAGYAAGAIRQWFDRTGRPVFAPPFGAEAEMIWNGTAAYCHKGQSVLTTLDGEIILSVPLDSRKGDT